jgi:hypothetical protein
MIARGLAVALVALSARAVAAPVVRTVEAGGTHWRIESAHGPLHVWRPAGYRRGSAGVVVYVHGLFHDVDGAWRAHRLAEQFAASGRNALFIACEAPAAAEEYEQPPRWPDLDQLIAAALDGAGLPAPPGPRVVVGHSGAYRTVVPWLASPSLTQLILLDALYGNQEEFRAWLDGAGHTMTLVARGTVKWAEPFARDAGAVVRDAIPESFEELTPRERAAKLLYLRAQYGHMELISDGKVLPVLLRRTTLKKIGGGGSGEERRP